VTDEQYICARNALIPKAERIAHARVAEHEALFGTEPVMVEGKADPITHRADKFRWSHFTQFFHEEMNRLAAQL